MKNNSETPKYIIVLGTTFSGSTAVYDYLYGRGDLNDPLIGKEYLLPILPNGLMALESVSDKAFDPATTEHALAQFRSIAFKLIDYWLKVSKDNKFNKRIPIFKSEIDKFIKEVSYVDFPMRLLWRDELMQSNIQRIIGKFKNRLGLKKEKLQTRLIVTKKN